MSTLTIESGVYVNTDASTTSRFTTINLANTQSNPREKVYPQGITGMESLVQPIQFEWTRFVREVLRDDLIPISATFVARGPRRNQAGFVDAVVNDDAELCKFTWTERDRRNGSTQNVSEWGYFQIVQPTIRGTSETATLVLYPVDRIRFIQSSTYLSVEQDS